ncbi:DUF2059 domain-containing protein [Blastomonas sp. AAP53]|uniref:DUF2059 domain-containing protein n=1 Tax=Blastomonas sp. AAP53 TaxID=1248760 RepID=UPI00031170E9|nr:DUF2059 domain-containing protein [Blastomonas sp. AAP53]
MSLPRRARLALAGVALAALAPTPAVAQAEPAATLEPGDQAPVDPARLAAARPVVEKLWPLGTYRRMMDSVMNGMMQQVMNQMFDMRAGDFAKAAGASEGDADATGDKTLGELASEADPHFRERTRIATDVMMREMIPLVEKLEPGIRDALATVYARKFSAEQLADMDRFFATPSGQAFAAEFMMTFVNPELMGQMQSFVPELMAAMPAIAAKVEAATAHLPPPLKPGGAGPSSSSATPE